MNVRHLTGPKGLQYHLYHQPDATDAVALITVAAGSLDESDTQLGLAHLLEHVLFCGSHAFSEVQSLMSWIPQQGGRLNATTQLSQSAFFFQLPADCLDEGMTRLIDMMSRPMLSLEAIRRETTVIEAEYQLLKTRPEFLSEAALIDGLGGLFRRFRIGNQVAFGGDLSRLQQALTDFHQKYYHAAGMTLWLSGPQSLDTLERMALSCDASLEVSGVTPSEVRPHPSPVQDYLLKLTGHNQFWLGLLINEDACSRQEIVPLLAVFWQDDAPGGLLARLREEGLHVTLTPHWLWQSTDQALLGICFQAATLSERDACKIEQLFWQHLKAVSAIGKQTVHHYLNLACKDFLSLSPLAQLQARAYGFAPPETAAEDFALRARKLSDSVVTRILTREQLSAPPYQTQGITLFRKPWKRAHSTFSDRDTEWHFYPKPSVISIVDHSAEIAKEQISPWLHIPSRERTESLILRPALFHPLDKTEAYIRGYALRQNLAELRHAGGQGIWQQYQTVWHLIMHLPPDNAKAQQSITSLLITLQKPLPLAWQDHRPPESVVIRQLLAALPRYLRTPSVSPPWLAVWCGQPMTVSQAFTERWLELSTDASTPPLQAGIHAISCHGKDAALLVFIPLSELTDSALAGLRAISLLAEPRFFQRLRVEQQVGYVVSARYQRIADTDGLLLALQSPDIAWRALLTACQDFLHDLADELLHIDSGTFLHWQQTLKAQCMPTNNVAATDNALRQKQKLPRLTPAAIDKLTPVSVSQSYLALISHPDRWRILINQVARTV